MKRVHWEQAQLLHAVTNQELRVLPKAVRIDGPLPDPPQRGWWDDPASDLGELRFHTGTEWSDLVWLGRAGYWRSTAEESRRRYELWREERAHEPRVTLASAPAATVVLFTLIASGFLIVAPALPSGPAADVAHRVGVATGLAVLVALCFVAASATRRVPREWRSLPLHLPYGVAIVAFVVLRGWRSVLAALGFG